MTRRRSRVARVGALPFRILRPDPDTDFLAESIPDEVTTSLSSLPAVTVRSPMVTAGIAGDPPDLKKLGAEAEIDAVLTGTPAKF